MSKNKGSFGKGKSPVEIEDEFVSGVSKVAEQLKPHAIRIAFAVGAVFVVFGLYAAYSWFQERKELKASAKFVEASEITRALVLAPGEKKPPLLGDQVKTYPSAKERAAAAAAAYAALHSEYGGTGVAAMTRLSHAGALMEQGNFDAALALYREQAADEDAPAILRGLAQEGIGYALEARASALGEAQKKAALGEALAAFEKMAAGDKGADKSPLRTFSLFHQGRIQAQLGNRPAAIAAYRKALESDAEAGLEDDVKNRLAVLERSGAR